MILTGLASIVVIEIYTSVMQFKFQDTDNKVGKGFAVLGIYLFVVTYCKLASQRPSPGLWHQLRQASILTQLADGMLNSTTWLYGAEVLPVALRSKVMGLSAASHFIVNVGRRLSPYTPSVSKGPPTDKVLYSYGSRPNGLRHHQAELLLRLRRLHTILLCHRLLLFPVGPTSFCPWC